MESIQSKYQFFTPGNLATIVLYILSVLYLVLTNEDYEFTFGWTVIGLTGLLLSGCSFYYIIPGLVIDKKSYLTFIRKIFPWLILTALPIFLGGSVLTNDGEVLTGVFLVNVFFQFFITMPLTWFLFKYKMKGKEDVLLLRKELKQSNAHFDLLRSQINPHFLFNTLNTLYGTAILEKATQTSRGIEKLGEMMRFMLHENLKSKTSLIKEIQYLRNYIDIQTLRTDSNPDIKIETEIDDPPVNINIAPMLLIPFVENAFKHGISLRKPSLVRITLEVTDDVLHFDVQNSKNPLKKNDPEKDKSGIGLKNVQQRLELLYPRQHSLMIRENSKDFFVHLTIRLK